jgi:hypothetical protein
MKNLVILKNSNFFFVFFHFLPTLLIIQRFFVFFLIFHSFMPPIPHTSNAALADGTVVSPLGLHARALCALVDDAPVLLLLQLDPLDGHLVQRALGDGAGVREH